MSNTITMEQTNKLVPELRFPEFVKDGEWEENEVGKFFKFKQGFQVSVENQYNNFTNGRVRFIRIIDITNNYEPKRYIDNPGSDYLIKKEDLFMIRYGSPGVVAIGYDGIIANNLFRLIWNLDTKFNHIYWFYTFQKIEKSIYNLSGSSSMPAISFTTLDNFNISYTKNSLEQQKIADCLSSLDEVITAHSEKLETLKNYKKGLLQNLFPQENQKVPHYRFPEFVNDGEWEKKKFGEVASFINGRAYKQEELLDSGKYRVLRVGNFFTNNSWYYSNLELDKDKYCDNGDLLYAWSASFGPRIWNGEKVIYHYHIWKVIATLDINKTFLFVLLDNETERMKSQNANGFALLHITKGTIENWKCYIPKAKEEQQKIADCLSAVDNLITAQTEKIEQLKTHKKGLMQGLFPKIEE